MLEEIPLEEWRIFLDYDLLNSAAGMLSEPFVKETFAFYSQTLVGVKKMKPLWRRALAATTGTLGELVGKVYVAEHFPPQAKRTMDRLVSDLRERGMLDDTLVIWGGEFGRTSYCQGALAADNYGRDHHPRCFTIWMAGGGVKPGFTYGQTDEYSYNIADADGRPLSPTKDRLTPGAVHVHDLHATILHLLGFDHERLTYRFQGRDYRLTDVHGKVVSDLLA